MATMSSRRARAPLGAGQEHPFQEKAVICTSDGLWTLRGRPVRGRPFAGRRVATGTATHTRTAVVVDDGEIWELARGRWRHVATADRRVHSLLYTRDHALLVASADGGIGRLSGHDVRWSAQVDRLRVLGDWRTPWGGTPDMHSLTRAGNGNIYACVHAGWMVRSDDDGSSWVPLRDGLAADVHDVEPHPLEPHTVLVATAQGVYVSEDGGDRFERRWDSAALQYLRACAVFGTGDVWLVSAHDHAKRSARAALFRSEDRGARWQRARGIPEWGIGHINTITVLDDGTALVLSPGRAFSSHDQGRSWQQLDLELPRRCHDPKLHFVDPVIARRTQ